MKADQRVADIKAEAEARVKHAEARADQAHDRLTDFGKFAMKCASKLVTDCTKPVKKASQESQDCHL